MHRMKVSVLDRDFVNADIYANWHDEYSSKTDSEIRGVDGYWHYTFSSDRPFVVCFDAYINGEWVKQDFASKMIRQVVLNADSFAK